MATLEGSVESIVFRNDETHYTVARFRPNDKGRLFRDDLMTIVGQLPNVHVGELLSVEGEWQTDPRYGRQLAVTQFVQRLPHSAEGMIRYLSSGLIKGIGPAKAKKIVDYFGEQSLAIIEQEPERLNEVKGLGLNDRERIIKAWAEQSEIKELHLFLQSHEVSLNLATRIYKHYGQEAIKVVRENPYQLVQDVQGIGFQTADEIAVKLGLPLDSQERLASGLTHVLKQAANDDGHCFLLEAELIERVSQILTTTPEALREAINLLRNQKDIFIEPAVPPNLFEKQAEFSEEEQGDPPQARIYYAPFWHAERGSARQLRRLMHTPSQLPSVTQRQWDLVFTYLDQKRQMQLTQKQREAVETSYHKKVSILTGGPGTGKSTSLRALLMLLRNRKVEVALAAPTGRAAKRLFEATGMHAKTLHRLLEYAPHDNSYQRNEEHQLPYQFVIVDEFSMVDILLFYNLLKALPSNAHLLLVGDADQLPSVGPGNVLRDLLQSQAVPIVRLTQLFRQAQESHIIVNAHKINAGELPDLRLNRDSDFLFLPEEDPIRSQELILDLVQRRLPARYKLNPYTDIQVLTPMYRGPVGVLSLNEELQARLNPSATGRVEWAGRTFRVGDKVMQMRNNYDKDVFNGDVGWIRRLNSEDAYLEVEFQEERGPLFVKYDFHELDELSLAYAVTVHKSQGSEYPAVVLPLVNQHYMLLQRNLLYTAITRAKRLCVVVGQQRALETAVKNDRVALRNTGLDDWLKKLI